MTNPERIHEAQLFWHNEDRNTAGWLLRYRDEHGDERDAWVDAAQDASTQELAEAIVVAIGEDSNLTGKVKVYRGGEPKGSITLRCGEFLSWEVRS